MGGGGGGEGGWGGGGHTEWKLCACPHPISEGAHCQCSGWCEYGSKDPSQTFYMTPPSPLGSLPTFLPFLTLSPSTSFWLIKNSVNR